MMRYQSGSLEAFQEIYAQLAPGVCRYLLHLAAGARLTTCSVRVVSRNDLRNDLTADIRETKLPALEGIRQLLVIDPQKI